MFETLSYTLNDTTSGMANNAPALVLLLTLVLIYLGDLKRSGAVPGILLMSAVLFISPDALHFVTLPIVFAYTICRVCERYEGKERRLAMALGIALFIAACSFDVPGLSQFRFWQGGGA